jgi:oligopeptide/dipeptide ABC transporter ATP-binding protein
MGEASDGHLLEVRDISVTFHLSDSPPARAVEDVSFHIDTGETLAIVGESGCGKSVTGLTLMRLVPSPPGVIEDGSVLFRGADLLALPEPEMRSIRGREIAMIFQEPMTSLNPVFKVGFQIAEAILTHQDIAKQEARQRVIELLRLVQIPDPEGRYDSYPHELSGGMRQRVMIAMALACNAQLLIADEPTTALDVTIQAQILELIQRLRDEFGGAVLLITHDLGVVAETADRVVVMYAGRVVEQSHAGPLFSAPLHPYTRGLLKSIPSRNVGRAKLPVIPGTVPDAAHKPSACHFHPRCPYVRDVCREEDPELRAITDGRLARCWALGDWLEVE